MKNKTTITIETWERTIIRRRITKPVRYEPDNGEIKPQTNKTSPAKQIAGALENTARNDGKNEMSAHFSANLRDTATRLGGDFSILKISK